MITVKTDPKLLARLQQIAPFIGNTPLFPLHHIVDNPRVKVFAKLEWQQLGGSVKARPAFNIIKNAIEEGKLDTERHLLDASSGNTAIAYAAIGAALSIPVTICLPENASEERKLLLKAYGAEVIYTSKYGSTDEAQEMALDLSQSNPDRYFYADQYGNDSNWLAHYQKGTADEIFQQTEGAVTHFVTGLGTTGSFTGTGRRLHELKPNISLTSLQPETALHGLEGWKHLETAKVPKIYDDTVADQNLDISTLEAYEWIKKAAGSTGLLLSPSSGANLAGAVKVAEKLEAGVVVTLFPDSAERYGEVTKSLFANG